MDILELMKTRYTTKHFDPTRKVSDEDIAKLMEVLHLAPSSLNCQPWQYFVTSDKAVFEKIKPALWELNYPRLDCSHMIIFTVPTGVDQEYVDSMYYQEKADGRFFDWTSPERPDVGRCNYLLNKTKNPQDWHTYASAQAHIALGCVTVAAAAMGIDSTIIGGYNEPMLDEIMGFDTQGLRSVVMLFVGYRAENDHNASRPKSRFPAERVIHYLDK